MGFTLQAPVPLIQTTTVLPNPIFGDSEGSTGELNILRTVGGKRRTYVKTKSRRRLRWDFRLTRNKALELFEFYRAYNAQQIQIQDHNNRNWVGNIINNPSEMEMSRRGSPTRQDWPVGETCRVSIEFEARESTKGINVTPKILLGGVDSDISFNQGVFIDTELPLANLVHNWDALNIIHADGTRLYVWPDLGPAGNDLIATVGGTFDPGIDRSPTFRKASQIFNLRPTVAFETVTSLLTSQTAAMRTTSNTTFFPSKRGTVFWVFAHTVNTNWSGYLNTLNPALAHLFSPGSRDAFLQAALANTSFNLSTEFGVWALEDKTGNPNVEQIHMSGSSNPLMPVNHRFVPPDPSKDIRLITSNTNAVPSLQPFIYTLSRDSNTNLRFRTNGIEREGATIKNNVGYTGIFRLNDQVFVPQFNARIRGEWGQFLVYDKALTTTQINEVERYLSLRWGIPLLTSPF